MNYFDTAAQYGNGESEKNLGRILNRLKPRDALVGTKVRVPADSKSVAADIVSSVEASLRRLAREQVDILHLHNNIIASGAGERRFAAAGGSGAAALLCSWRPNTA